MPVAGVGRALEEANGRSGEAKPAVPDGPYLVAGMGQAGQAAIEALVARTGPSSVRVWDPSSKGAAHARAIRRSLERRGLQLVSDPAHALDGMRAVVKSPGILPGDPLLEDARRRGIPMLDEFELGWRLTTRPVVAVTGTNGKSTTAALIHSALAAAGGRPVLAGNVDAGRGSPLSAVPPEGDGWVVAEVSSYQAAGSPEFVPAAAVFTNLTQDHLHWHGSMTAYAAAKRRVFVRGNRCVDLAVVNTDDALGRRLAREVIEREGRALTYGFEPGADYRIQALGSTLRSGRVQIAAPSGGVLIETRLPGEHNALNVASALALADGLGLPRERTLGALARMRPVPGRFEPVDAGQDFDVIVDFAHSPDAVTRVLATVRELAHPRGGRVIAVMHGATRSHRATREATGRAVRAGSDHLVLCATSTKGEPRMIALKWLLAGARKAEGGTMEVVLDRRAAIARALSLARPDDLVVILGRGANTVIAHDARGGRGFFDDRLVARELLS